MPTNARATTERPGVQRLRRLCLALPDATEVEAWGDPTFRVRGKIFAMNKVGDGRSSVWCKAPDGAQAMLVDADPESVFVPPYVGAKGWIGVRIDRRVDWARVAHLVETSYRAIAPKTLVARLDGPTPARPRRRRPR